MTKQELDEHKLLRNGLKLANELLMELIHEIGFYDPQVGYSAVFIAEHPELFEYLHGMGLVYYSTVKGKGWTGYYAFKREHKEQYERVTAENNN